MGNLSSCDTDNFFIEVTVSDPENVTSIFWSYIQYKLTCVTNRPDFGGRQFTVFRRYRDFEKFYFRLHREFPDVSTTAQLPPKRVSWLNRMSKEDIEFRREQLQNFISKVAVHPDLRDSRELKRFLCCVWYSKSDTTIVAHQEVKVMYSQAYRNSIFSNY